MKKTKHIISFLMLTTTIMSSIFTTSVFADYDKRCLDTCFKTCHNCNYCNYQCYQEDVYVRTPNYSGDTVCPLFGYHNYGNDDYDYRFEL